MIYLLRPLQKCPNFAEVQSELQLLFGKEVEERNIGQSFSFAVGEVRRTTSGG